MSETIVNEMDAAEREAWRALLRGEVPERMTAEQYAYAQATGRESVPVGLLRVLVDDWREVAATLRMLPDVMASFNQCAEALSAAIRV